MAATLFRTVAAVFQDRITGPISAASGAISYNNSGVYNGETNTPAGLVPITYDGGAGAYTLVAPVAGLPILAPSSTPQGTGLGGDDGKEITILSTTAHAHVVTCPANSIIDETGTPKDTMTFAAAIGANIVLKAYGGKWYLITKLGVTLTEV